MGDYREFRVIVPIDRWSTPAQEKIREMQADPSSVLNQDSGYFDSIAESHLSDSDPHGNGTNQFSCVFNLKITEDEDGYDFIRWLATVSPVTERTLIGWERADQAEIPTLIFLNGDKTVSFLRPSRTEIKPIS